VDGRLPAHLEVSGLIRAVEAAGGFATVIAKGERDAGTLLVVCCERGAAAAAYERMPQPDGSRAWSLARKKTLKILRNSGITARGGRSRTTTSGWLNWMSRMGNGSSFNGNSGLTPRDRKVNGAATSNSAD
jgi:hypothetical protein